MLLSVVLLLVFLTIVFIYSIRSLFFRSFGFPPSCLLACLLSIALASAAAAAEVLVF